MLRAFSRSIWPVIAVLAIAACQRQPSPLARTIVGNWKRTGFDVPGYVSYRPDGTFENYGNQVELFRKGTWHIRGDELIEDSQLDWTRLPGITTTPKRTTRTRFAEIHRDELKSDSRGGPVLVRVQ